MRDLGPRVGASVGPRGGAVIQAEKIFKDSDKQLRELRTQERQIRQDRAIAPSRRQKLLDANHEQQRTIMRAARRYYEGLQPAQAH